MTFWSSTRFRFGRRAGAVLAAMLVVSASALAVMPYTWVASTEADFSAGERDSAVATSRGEAILARDTKIVLPSTSAPAVISAVLRLGNTIYAAAGNSNTIYRIDAGHPREFAKPPGTMITAMLWTGHEILVGTGGEGAGVYRLDPKGKCTKVWTEAKVRFVWALALDKAGRLHAGTGPEGKVFQLDGRGGARVVFDAGELAHNILSLARGQGDKLYAGTDKAGLVVEIDTRRRQTRVIFDAPENEISALIADDEGGLYVATADTAKASSDGKDEPSKEKKGKAVPATKPAGKATTGGTTRPAAKGAKGAPGASGAKRPAGAKSLSPKAASKPAPKAVVIRRAPHPPTPPSKSKSTSSSSSSAKGNAVYYIAPDGLVAERFRRPVTILAMIRRGDQLILGTGNGGKVYAVDIDGDRVVPLLDTDTKQVTCLAPGRDGQIAFGTANKGSVGVLSTAYAKKGTVISNVLDAKQITRWGTLRGRADIPKGCGATVATRSGNVSKADDKTWSSWSREQPLDGEFRPIMSPTARFLQFRLTLRGDGKATPTIHELRMIHQVGNLAPELGSVEVKISNIDTENKPQPTRLFRHVQVKASDANKDRLSLEIAFRQAGQENWIVIAEKYTKTKFVWDTRTVGDGEYEVRVTVTDAPSNPGSSALTAARIVDGVTIDNTSPIVRGVRAAAGDGKVRVTGSVDDATSRLAALYYAVDSQKEWHPIAPTDGICDSPREKFQFDIEDLKPGAHRIAVKAYDYFGNPGFSAVTVVVPK